MSRPIARSSLVTLSLVSRTLLPENDGPLETRRDFHFSSPNLVSPSLTSIRFTLCLVHPRTTVTSIKHSKISPISNTMRNWDENSPPQSHASSKSKQESDQISASTQFKMESTSSSKKTPDDLDLSKHRTDRVHRRCLCCSGSIRPRCKKEASTKARSSFDSLPRVDLFASGPNIIIIHH
jgi:hypothetical protein